MAQEWAEKLMAEGKFEHRKDKKGKGENIATCSTDVTYWYSEEELDGSEVFEDVCITE